MSKIIPFPALLPKRDLAGSIASPPYDVVTTTLARSLAKNNKRSFLHITRAEIDLPEGTDEHSDAVYKKARENYRSFLNKGWLFSSAPAFFVYRIEGKGHVQTGIVSGVSVDEYDSGFIKKHEKTRKIKEDDRTRFAMTIAAHAEPVFLVFKKQEPIAQLINEAASGAPFYGVRDSSGFKHELWRANNAEKLAAAFLEINALYIADGHHRSAAASRVREEMREKNPHDNGDELYNYFPAVIFPDDEVRIYRYEWDGEESKRPRADVTMKDIMKLADEGGIMPPKSTWFAPKLLSGLFVYPFDGSK